MHLKARSGLFVCKKILYHFFAEFWPKTPNRPQVRREPRSSCLKGHVHPSLDKNLQGSFVISCFTFLVGTAILVNHFWGRGNWGSKTVHSLKSMISCQGCQGWHLRQGLLATRGVARLTQWNTRVLEAPAAVTRHGLCSKLCQLWPSCKLHACAQPHLRNSFVTRRKK